MISSKTIFQVLHRIQLKLGLVLLLLPVLLSACEVPVFRFALERWENDPFTLLIKHPQELSAEQIKVLTAVRSQFSLIKSQCNLILKSESSPINSFSMELRYPEAVGILRPAWSGELTQENFAKIIDSPLRKDIHQKIIAGASIVWLVLKTEILF